MKILKNKLFHSFRGQLLLFIGGILLVLLLILIGTLLAPSGQPETSLLTRPESKVSKRDDLDKTFVKSTLLNDFGEPFIGDKDAAIQVYEFFDFGCPFCRKSSVGLAEMIASFGGTVRLVYKDFPLTSLHPGADLAAQAGQCAKEQGLFGTMAKKLYAANGDFSQKSIISYAQKAGLDKKLFIQCFTSQKYKNEVQSDLREGISLGVKGTPTWFINGNKISGVLSADDLKMILIKTFKAQK